MASPKVEVVAHRTCKNTGEGPHWEESSQSLLYVDIQCGDVHRWDSLTGKDEVYHVGDGTCSLAVPKKSGGFIVGFNKTLTSFHPETGSATTLLMVEHKKHNRFNDGKCDPAGRLWAGTMAENTSKDPADLRRNDASLYTLETNGSLKKRVEVVDLSNGLAWTADNKTMYFIDSLPRCIYAFDYDIETGDVTNQREIIKYPEDSIDTLGYPDGMCIDTEDKIWVANYSAGKVIRWDPETGNQLQVIEIPGAKRTTSCCWGGKNYDELYVTSCAIDMTEDDFETEANAGSVFRVTGLGAKGLPPHIYQA